MGMSKRHKPFYNLVLTDRQVFDCCKLRGFDASSNFLHAVRVIEEAYHCTLRRWQPMRSPLGGVYGRWEVYQKK